MLPGDIPWNEIERNWQCEPEIQNPPPRRVKPHNPPQKLGCGQRLKGCAGGGCLNAFLLFTLATGLFIGYWVGLAILIEPFGSVATGRVTHHKYHQGTPYLGFEWRHNGTRYSGEAVAGEDLFWLKQNGAPVQVRYFPFVPNLRPVLEEDRLWWGFAALLAPVSLLLIGIGGLPILGMFPLRRRSKILVARGTAVAAVVVRVRFVDERTREIEFLYRVNGRVYEGKTRLVDEALPTENEILTALVDPRKPARVILYRGADWRAIA